MTAKAIMAGIMAASGATRKTTLSAVTGMIPSLKKSFTPSASVISTPAGPARFGPMRVCMSATTFRSIQMASMTATRRATKMTATRATARIQPTQSNAASVMPAPPWAPRP
jgi:hypothetical protein